MDPRQVFHYKEHPLELLRDFPDERALRRALREMQRELQRWEAQRTPEQAAWVAARKPRFDVEAVARQLAQRGRSGV